MLSEKKKHYYEMENKMLGALLLQIVLIFLNAVFASAEIAVISLNETKLRQDAKEGDVRAKKLVDLTEQPAKQSLWRWEWREC